ncbi:TetR/AcrR family transcriptional regulator [Streptomyces sp. TRM 70361]|uniref:TetR/AcrR family transcriptional regulator n=1 Tax=Streptomyces sp. TRM 70361 TaxID=3116553 RepID=UPI002E7B9A74|nr:TetR/AcrR family transcriptional regulator [Streptomyces sp. TRM 70361]MEE1942555.1 TetR/AcrR family transcriptional regulator [Streptomyces sp. TRM 70361]
MTPTAAERGQETRTRLLDAAARLIVEEGWGAVTTRKVADRAGLRPGLVHYHFHTVTDLLIDASLESARREVRGALEAVRSTGAAAGLDLLLEAVAEYSPEDPGTILFTEMLLAARRHERLRAGMAELLREWRTAVADWLRAAGRCPDPEATAVLLGAALDSLVLHRMIDPELVAVPVSGPLRRLVGAPASAPRTGPPESPAAPTGPPGGGGG